MLLRLLGAFGALVVYPVVAYLVLASGIFTYVTNVDTSPRPSTPVLAVTSCEEHGPISFWGFGTWWECRALLTDVDGKVLREVSASGYLTPDDIGEQVPVNINRNGQMQPYDGSGTGIWLFLSAIGIIPALFVWALLAAPALAANSKKLAASVDRYNEEKARREAGTDEAPEVVPEPAPALPPVQAVPSGGGGLLRAVLLLGVLPVVFALLAVSALASALDDVDKSERPDLPGIVATSCVENGPVSHRGIGTWWRCRAKVVSADGEVLRSRASVDGYLTPADIGKRVPVDLERNDRFSPHRNTGVVWLLLLAVAIGAAVVVWCGRADRLLGEIGARGRAGNTAEPVGRPKLNGAALFMALVVSGGGVVLTAVPVLRGDRVALAVAALCATALAVIALGEARWRIRDPRGVREPILPRPGKPTPPPWLDKG
ncbi:hypothetical protein GCM10010428_34130 [Actinosynnema pretiosum subsp. pretiosum]